MLDTTSSVLMKLGGLFSTSTLFYLAAFVAVLSVIVFVHEFGHFIVGRWCGVEAEEFSIGFGKEIVGYSDKRGTRWKLCWMPFGGYVRFVGDMNAASLPDKEALADMPPAQVAGSLSAQPAWKRALVVGAGPLANFLFAIVIFTAFLGVNGKTTIEPRIDGILDGGRAEAAGLKVGDLLLSIDGVKINDFYEVSQRVAISAEQPLNLVVLRDGKEISIAATPALKKIKSLIGYVDGGQLGFSVDATIPGRMKKTQLNIAESLVEGGRMTWAIVDQSLQTIVKLVSGKISFSQVSGPIGMAQMTGKVAERGLLDLISFAALLSVSIGMVNLLPIPVLDGGHLLFCLIEILTRRPLNERIQEAAFKVGFVFILLIMVLASWGDLVRNFAQ